MKENIIFSKSSEEYKAIKYLEYKTTNYTDDSLVIHYNTILYNLIINLMKENEKQKEINQKAIEYIKENCVQSYCLPSGIYDTRWLDRNELLQILENKEA